MSAQGDKADSDPPLTAGQKRPRSPSTGEGSAQAPILVDVDVDEDLSPSSPEAAQTEQEHEKADDGKGQKEKKPRGQPKIKLLNAICTKFVRNGQPWWKCIACGKEYSGSPGTGRTYKHAGRCKNLQKTHPDLFRQVQAAQAGTSLGAQKDADAAESADEPPRKKQKSGASVSSSDAGAAMLEAFVTTGARQQKAEAQQLLQRDVDQAIVRFICVRGIVPSAFDSPEWREIVHRLNSAYNATSSSTFEDKWIPREAAHVRQKQLELLHTRHNITVSFDGGSTRRDGICFVHATQGGESFFIDGHVGTDESHDSDWYKTKLEESTTTIGTDRVSTVVSDEAAVCVKARRELVEETLPLAFNLNDSCHKLHNTIKDITKLEYFDWMFKQIKPLLTHFSKSTYGRAHLSASAAEGEKVQALQKIGKTRFGSHYMASTTVHAVFANIRELCRNGTIKFSNQTLQTMFRDRLSVDYNKVDGRMEQYNLIVSPLARSIWCLESSRANAADVFIFWLAMAAHLAELFHKPESETGIPRSVADAVVDIFNDRFDEMFDPEHDHYFVAFALDPRYPVADVLLIVETAQPSITIPRQGADLAMPHPRAYDRVKEFLKTLLRKLVNRAEEIKKLPDDQRKKAYIPGPLRNLTPADAALALKDQLAAFWRGQRPFDQPFKGDDPLQWWGRLARHRDADVLAMLATRLLSALPNSMPDERTGSTFTWLNSAVRGCQHAQTLIDMVQIRQWYLREQKLSSAETPKRPTVKFRDVKADILKRMQTKSRKARNGGSEPDEGGIDEIEDDPSSASRPQPSRSRSSSPSVLNPAERLLLGQDVNLRSIQLLDMLSDVPLAADTAVDPQNAAVVEETVQAEADWAF